MIFSENFKRFYWLVIFIFLTIVCGWRLVGFSHSTFDIYLFFIWLIILLLPLISEMSAFGVSVKKELEVVKKEISGQLAEIKNSITNNQNFAVNIHTMPANETEVRRKQEEEISGHEKLISYFMKRNGQKQMFEVALNKIDSGVDLQIRAEKVTVIESQVDQYLFNKYGERYRSKMKLEDSRSKKSIVVDGIVADENNNIIEIVEIKCLSSKPALGFFFVVVRFVEKLKKLGVQYPVRFILVSNGMDAATAYGFQQEINKFRYAGTMGARLPRIKSSYFRFENDQILEVSID